MGDIGPARQRYDVLPVGVPDSSRDVEPEPVRAAGPVVERHDTSERTAR